MSHEGPGVVNGSGLNAWREVELLGGFSDFPGPLVVGMLFADSRLSIGFGNLLGHLLVGDLGFVALLNDDVYAHGIDAGKAGPANASPALFPF